MTFESGSLTGNDAAEKTTAAGTLTLNRTSPLSGTVSVTVPQGSVAAYVEQTFTAADEVFTTFRFRPGPFGKSDVRIAQIVHGTGTSAVTSGALLLKANGVLQLRNANSTIGGSQKLTAGTHYRIGLHEVRTSASTMKLEAFIAPVGVNFGSPFASTASTPLGTTVGAGTVRVGATGSSGGLQADIDDIKIDTKFMPGA